MKYGLLLVVAVAVATFGAMVVGCKSEESQGEAGAKVAQKTCPVMAIAIDKSISVDYEGKRVYLCCNKCEATFEKDPEKYLKELAEMGEEPIAVPQGES